MIFHRSKAQSASRGSIDAFTSEDSALPVSATVLTELTRAADSSYTGALTVKDSLGKVRGELFCFEGRIYAAAINGFEPGVLSRLVSSGLITQSDVDLIEQADVESQSLSAGIVNSGRVSVDQLASVHQEFVMASVGALLLVGGAHLIRNPDQLTSHVCTLPLDLDHIVKMIEIRYRRMAQDALELSKNMGSQESWVACEHPGSAVLACEVALSPAHVSLVESAIPEIRAVFQKLDAVSNLDVIASECGFTRAEVVHIARSLVDQGLARLVSCDGDSDPSFESGQEHLLLVPEECSSREWSLASIALPHGVSLASTGSRDDKVSITYSPSHNSEIIVVDHIDDNSQNFRPSP